MYGPNLIEHPVVQDIYKAITSKCLIGFVMEGSHGQNKKYVFSDFIGSACKSDMSHLLDINLSL